MQPVVTLEIDKASPNHYAVHCEVLPDSPTFHATIADAIRHYGISIPRDFSQFAEVRYGGVSLGTQAVSRLAEEPAVMARELVELDAAVHRSIFDVGTLNEARGTRA